MGEPMEITPPTIATDVETIHSKIRALRELQATANDIVQFSSAESEDQLVHHSAIHLQDQIEKALTDFTDIGLLPVEDLDGLLERLKEELDIVEAESSKVSTNIDDLARNYFGGFTQLENELVQLSCAVESTASKGIEKANTDGLSASPHDKIDFSSLDGNCKFQILELNDQIERKKLELETLQNLDSILKRFEAIEQFEDALTGLKVTEYEQNSTRLSLRTHIPISENFLSQHKLEESLEQLEQSHELLIEFVEGTLELKNVEIFPGDVYIADIIEAAKALRQSFSSSLMLEGRSSLEWLVRKVQDRVVLCTLRQLLMKNANKSRHSFEYLDRDETVVAHMVGGVSAYIKMPVGWPVSDHSLKLISLKSSGHNANEISLSFLCKVEEMANSLDPHIRNSITSFMDAIEEILMQQMRAELQS